MNVFWYFLPGAKALPTKAADLPQPLAEVLADAEIAAGELPKGPDGKGVVVFGNPADPRVQAPPLIVTPETRWHEVGKDEGRYFIGWNPSAPPTPEGLLRKRPLGGRAIELGDGRSWECPELHAGRLNAIDGFRINAAGEVETAPLERYAWLCEEVAKYQTHLKMIDDGGAWQPTFADLYRFGVKLLEQNYRVGVHECSMDVLNLLTVQTVWRPLWAALGLYDAMIQKKTGG